MFIIKFIAQFLYFITISVPACAVLLLLIELRSAGSALLVWFIRLVKGALHFYVVPFYLLNLISY